MRFLYIQGWPQVVKKCLQTIPLPVCSRNLLYRSKEEYDQIYLHYYRQTPRENLRTLHYVKGLLAVSLFCGVLTVTWVLRNKRIKRLDTILKDCKQIPIDKNLFQSNVSLYRYKGFVLNDHILMSGVLQNLDQFELREEDIIVASFPKTGTTWVQEIVYMLKNNFTGSNDSSPVLETRFPYLEYPYPGLKALSKLKGGRLIKTHLPSSLLPESFTSSGAKLIYIRRNPRDTAVSYYHFLRLLSHVSFKGSFKDFLDLFLGDIVPYAPFFDHLNSYRSLQNSQPILIVTYEDLKRNPIEAIKAIAEYLQVSITDEEALLVAANTTFTAMSKNKSVNYEHWREMGFSNKNEGRFMRKGEVGDWKNYFTPELINKVEHWERSQDPKHHFKFQYELQG